VGIVKVQVIWNFAWRYLALSVLLHFAWELAQLPLYTLWKNPDNGSITYAIVHCTLGDLLIAASTLGLGLTITQCMRPTTNRLFRTAFVTMALGVAYTIFSEWLNTMVLRSWAYSELMPQVFSIGVSPIMQWIVIPAWAFIALRKKSSATD
jgi:hypothetical protein